ncbi:MAG: NAD-binding protein [Betaproteobacteria bacterium]|nr:NAD-binding protein [Betaproteobacteria bacterium]
MAGQPQQSAAAPGEPSAPVGVIGVGIMGGAMVRHLVAAGFPVVGHDVDARAMATLAELGGQPAASAAEVAARCPVVISSLPSVAALESVVSAIAARPGLTRVLAETSTFGLRDKLAAQARLQAAGIGMLDAPLSGSGNQAAVRDVVVYASGEPAHYERCLPAFQAFSRAPHLLGPFGNGTRMKFVANLMVAIHTAAAGEAFALARKVGLDPAQVLAMMTDGAAYSRSLAARGEMLVADSYLPVRTMPLDLWRKDLKAITEFATEAGCPTPVFAAVVPMFLSAVARGLGPEDTAAVARVSGALAGLDDAGSPS